MEPGAGGQVRYWVRAEHYGILGGTGFAVASPQVGPRDRWLGWSVAARVANIGRVISNHRFLLLSGVRVAGLASQVIRPATSTVARDWATIDGVPPVLLPTFVGRDQSGLSYRAAGWSCCPERTSGRRSGVTRAVWGEPLVKAWRPTLTEPPPRRLGGSGSLATGDSWAEREYRRSSHPDGRICRRIVAMGKAWENRLGANIPVLLPGVAEPAAADRLRSNPSVTMHPILESQVEQTVERCQAERPVLAIQDTTTRHYDGLSPTPDRDALGGGKGRRGRLFHAGVTVKGVGRPLGMFAAAANFRRADDNDSARWLQDLAKAQEFEQVGQRTRVVSVGDREGDFWELLRHAHHTDQELFVRSANKNDRRIRTTDGSDADLWQAILATAPVSEHRIRIPASGGPHRRKERKAKLPLRCQDVSLLPPQAFGSDEPLHRIAISAKEDPPQQPKRGNKHRTERPLHWVLLLSKGSADLDAALAALRW